MMDDKTCGTCRHAMRSVIYCGRTYENTIGLLLREIKVIGYEQ